MKDLGWRFDKIDSMTIYYYKTTKMNHTSHNNIHLRSSGIFNIENNDKHCFIWSILTYLHPCNTSHSNRVSNHRPYFNQLNIEGFDFSKVFLCNDVHKFEKLNKLSIKIF